MNQTQKFTSNSTESTWEKRSINRRKKHTINDARSTEVHTQRRYMYNWFHIHAYCAYFAVYCGCAHISCGDASMCNASEHMRQCCEKPLCGTLTVKNGKDSWKCGREKFRIVGFHLNWKKNFHNFASKIESKSKMIVYLEILMIFSAWKEVLWDFQ